MIDIHKILQETTNDINVKITVHNKKVMFHIEGFNTEDDALYYATMQTFALELMLLQDSTIH